MLMSRTFGRLVVAVLTATSFQAVMAAGVTAKAATKPAAKPAVRSTAQKSPVTISLTSQMREGNLVVLLDGVPVFNEPFKKPALIISQTTTWDPLQVTAGKHKLAAKVYGTKGRTFLSPTYTLVVSRHKGTEVRFRMKGDMLTVEPAS